MIRVLRLEAPLNENHNDKRGAVVVHVVDRLTNRDRTLYDEWSNLPNPWDDLHLVTGKPIEIGSDERCASADTGQFSRWWPRWAWAALVHSESRHDVELVVYDVDPDNVRIGRRQCVFRHGLEVARIPLAASGMEWDEMVAYFNNQSADAAARGDSYGTLAINA